MKGCDFVFDYVHILYYKYHKINPNRGGSYIESSDWIKNKQQQFLLIKEKVGENSEKYITFRVPIEKKWTKLIKMD